MLTYALRTSSGAWMGRICRIVNVVKTNLSSPAEHFQPAGEERLVLTTFTMRQIFCVFLL